MVEKKAAAQTLFNEGWSQVDIARCLKISEVTISTWAKKERWKQQRSNAEQFNKKAREMAGELLLYQLEALNRKIRKYRSGVESEDDELPMLEKEHTALIGKIISEMKAPEMRFQQMVRLLDELTQFAGERNIELAKMLAEVGPEFIEEKRKSYV